jgi:hypothetical protein
MLRFLPLAALDLTGLELDSLPAVLVAAPHDLVDKRVVAQSLGDGKGDRHGLRLAACLALLRTQGEELLAEAAAGLRMAALELVLCRLVTARPTIAIARPKRLSVPRPDPPGDRTACSKINRFELAGFPAQAPERLPTIRISCEFPVSPRENSAYN